MLYRMLMMWRALSHSFNYKISPLFTIIAFLMLRGLNAVGLALDGIFFPQVRRVKIVKPIVIVGNPRSGTTFLQRFLVEHDFGAGMRLWKMLFPALTLQTLVKPLLPILERFSPAKHHASAAHKTSLTGIETDDPALFFHYFDGFFAYGFFLAWAKQDLRALFDPAIRDTSQRDFAFLEKMWIRTLISEKKSRMIPKLFSLTVRIPPFLQKFPDAKILYMVRDPLSTVPSGMSLVTGALDGRFGFWSLPEEKRRRYISRLYNGFLDLSLRFQQDYVNGNIPRESVMVVPYDRLMTDFDNLMLEIMDFIEVTPASDLMAAIQMTAEKQRHYRSDHQYDLAKFGLSEEKIREDYAPIYATFLREKGER
ncbi:sulfotransferase [candidate division KSB1 bacterium]|nr:sulfotransferase [candidate division KSB1 bacterium]